MKRLVCVGSTVSKKEQVTPMASGTRSGSQGPATASTAVASAIPPPVSVSWPTGVSPQGVYRRAIAAPA